MAISVKLHTLNLKRTEKHEHVFMLELKPFLNCKTQQGPPSPVPRLKLILFPFLLYANIYPLTYPFSASFLSFFHFLSHFNFTFCSIFLFSFNSSPFSHFLFHYFFFFIPFMSSSIYISGQLFWNLLSLVTVPTGKSAAEVVTFFPCLTT